MPDDQPLRRIAVLGSSGAGKSTLARRIGEITGLPVVHLDKEHWQPGWVEPDREAWQARLTEIAAQPEWVIDGQYGASLPARLARADLAIFLDPPTWLCLWRVIQRFVALRGRVRPDMGEGCPEKLDLEFLHYVVTFRRRQRPKIIAALDASGVRTLRFCDRQDQATFARTLQRDGLAAAAANATAFRAPS
ncbi:topology modulation protein [Sphingomonas sp.]|uniref:topology modulation protein n=1 Tax=Sphingomonas sp. TaxID=28214 RepID=UPI002E36E108|nr:topology modulation protein [Sphingomonas sp.]HEX4693434.1 topology modulation protein [Sphingomonas sp.]